MAPTVGMKGERRFLSVSSSSSPQHLPSLWQMVQITRSSRDLVGWRGWRLPRRGVEVKELGHIHLSSVARGQAMKVEPRFNQLQDRRIVGHRVGDKILLGKG